MSTDTATPVAETAPAAAPAARKNRQLSTTVEPKLYADLQDFRFENRIEKIGDVLTQALTEFVANHKIGSKTSGDKPAKA